MDGHTLETHREQAVRILRSWHLVEFFQPYSLPEKSDPNLEHIKISLDELARQRESLFPWLDANACDQLGIKDDRSHHFVLYLGLFDKSILKDVCQQRFGDVCGQFPDQEFAERSELEGYTCFAKLHLDAWGSPNFSKMSVSTLPWALGHLQADTIDQLTLQSFDQRCELLAQAVERFGAGLPQHPRNPASNTLDAQTLIQLVQTLYEWANFCPDSEFGFILDWFEVKQRKPKAVAFRDDSQSPTLQQSAGETAVENDEDEEQEAQAQQLQDLSSDERVMPILNSFYIEDIERAINSIYAGDCNPALLQYLHIREHKLPDLYSQQGLALIEQGLAPKFMPPGRWPSPPCNNMTLMQQFAINSAFSADVDQSVLSVNGPPGTGKTTLLRDVIAQNIVARAKVLAGLNSAGDGLTEMGLPIDALSGFEMVVASTNNLAVENISKELPLLSSIAAQFDQLDHFKPIANQLNATKTRKGYQPLSIDEQCWGVISAVLGNYNNRNRFVDSFFFDCHFAKGSDDEANRPESYNLLNFYQWSRVSTALDFNKTKRTFSDLVARFEQQIGELEQLASLTRWLAENPREAYLTPLQLALQQAKQQEQNLQTELTQLEQQLDLAKDRVEIVSLSYDDAKFQGDDAQINNHRRDLIEAKQAYSDIKSAIFDGKNNLPQRQMAIENAQSKLDNTLKEYNENLAIFNRLKTKHANKSLPQPGSKIDDPQIQREGFWQDEELNQLRAEIFIAALNLHQAWLGSVMKLKHFRDALYQVKHVIRGKPLENAKGYWQLLFLLVPVVSTTFASLGRMFKALKTAELGWLMIDEAGQAVPQAAVGGIWRAKKVLAVGDPLQIEPVFTTPPKLTEILCQAVLADDAKDWDPQLMSVQQVCDRANPYGCLLNVQEIETWIGIPLWVHRRCIEPMFSIANQIAYDGRMIHGLASDEIQALPHPILGDNFWLDSKGICTVKQYKDKLGDDTITLLFQLAQRGENLKDVYIISPFRAVKQQLAKLIDQQQRAFCQAAGFNQKQYYQWRNKNIGTVHTFQGKENTTVILVLGCDPQNAGGANWAAQKPNLLNVALTRAKRHCFVIGDLKVWQNLRYFDQLACLHLKKA